MSVPLRKAKRSSEFPTNWDVDSYRTDYESEEHWQLRRRFMQVHKSKFPEDRLVCLAAVFTNMEFMGCKYPSETMHLVAELGKEVVKDYRESRVNRLKRTFVAASDAAEARVKGRRNAQQQQQQQQQNDQPSCSRYNNSTQSNHTNRRENGARYEVPSKRPAYNQQCNLFENLQFGRFVLFLSGGRNCIRTSAQRCNVEFEEKELTVNGKRTIEIHLNGRIVTSASEDNIKLSKAQAFNNAMELLQQNCYSIKPNPSRDTIKINKSNNQVVCGVSKQNPSDGLDDKKLDASNKGYKMMKLMGWAGGGLGSKTQGREEPVGYLLKNNRAGLGNNACKLDRTYFTKMLKNYVDSEDIRELQFESTFTKDERAMLHEIAGKFNLKSNSYGKDDSRRLVISKKTITNEQILTEVLVKKNTSYIDKYFVQVPESKARFYPEYTTKLELDI